MLLGILNAQASGGGAGAFDLLETTTLTSTAASVTFSGLDAYSDYKHLQVRFTARSPGAFSATNLLVQFNNVTTSSYAYHQLFGNGSGIGNPNATNTTVIFTATIPGANETAGVYAAGTIDVLDFSSNQKNTTLRSLNGRPENIAIHSGLFVNTAAITALKVFSGPGDLAAGSRFSLYGIRG